MHCGGRHHTGIDQRLRALLAFDQDDVAGGHQTRLVVQRAWLGRCHLAALGVPRPEFLFPARWVVAVDNRDQFASGIKIVPLGGRWAEIVGRRSCLGFAHRC